ncbi:MAG: hypothetical protein HQL54_10250 [Magnetococcales bacterium]|nr:hypothetical protein [Magnetococcales bacterium]
MSQTATKMACAQLVREINTLFKQGEMIDPFTLARLTKAADNCRTSEPLLAFLALGRIACLEHNPSKMETYHKMMVNTAPDNPRCHLFYSISLRSFGFFSEACQRAKSAFDLDPDDKDIVQNRIRAEAAAGRFRKAARLMNFSINANMPLTVRQFDFIKEVTYLLTEAQIDDVQTEALQQTAMALLDEHQIYPWGSLRFPMVRMALIPDVENGNPSPSAVPVPVVLEWHIQINADEQTIAQLNNQLAQRVAADDQFKSVTQWIHFQLISKQGGRHGNNIFFA